MSGISVFEWITLFFILILYKMDNIQKRFLLFLFGCMGMRLFLVYIAKNINTIYLPYLGYLALIPAFGFISIYLTGSRKTGPEVFGDQIWWNDLRPIHSLLYFLESYHLQQYLTSLFLKP